MILVVACMAWACDARRQRFAGGRGGSSYGEPSEAADAPGPFATLHPGRSPAAAWQVTAARQFCPFAVHRGRSVSEPSSADSKVHLDRSASQRHTSLSMGRELWQGDGHTVLGTARSFAADAIDDDGDDYAFMDIQLTMRAADALEARSKLLGIHEAKHPAQCLAEAFRAQAARQGDEAERLFVSAVSANRTCGAAWYGLASLLHEYQHGGLATWTSRTATLSEARDAALVAARCEPQHPRPVVLLGDVLNDLGDYPEACRAWRAAEVRGESYWHSMTKKWVSSAQSAFGPREPLRSLLVGGEPVELRRASSEQVFTVRRLANRPATFLLSNFSTASERAAIEAAALDAPMRDVPASDSASADDRRDGCAVAWLPSPLTEPASAWAQLMHDSAELVLPRAVAEAHGVPGAGALEDLHVVRYGAGGAYGLHLDATTAVPRAVTVLHYLNDVPEGEAPGLGGETWLPHADEKDGSEAGASNKPVPGRNGVLVPPRAGDALVFFSFDDDGNVERAALHGGRPSPQTKWVANQWIRLDLQPSGLEQEVSNVASNAEAVNTVPRGPGFGPRVIT